jgi:hypothetical protein
MAVTQNQVAFDVGTARLVSKLVEGNYPNYRQVIPSEVSERVTLERTLFLAAVQRVSLLASEKSNSVKLMLTQDNLEIAANTPDVGEARESIPLAYKGKEISIAFNPEYLMAPLKALPNEEVFLDLRAHFCTCSCRCGSTNGTRVRPANFLPAYARFNARTRLSRSRSSAGSPVTEIVRCRGADLCRPFENPPPSSFAGVP